MRARWVLIAAVLPVVLWGTPAQAAGPQAGVLAASAESDTYDSDGTEHYLQVMAEAAGGSVSVTVGGFTAGVVTCADGSTAYGFTMLTGSGGGGLDISGPLDRAVAEAAVDLTSEVYAGCPEDVGRVDVRAGVPFALVLDAVGPPLRVLDSARVRVPGQRNDLHLQRQTVRRAEGVITLGSASTPTSSGSIERTHTVVRDGQAGTFLATLATAEHSRSRIVQARGFREETAAELPPVGGVVGRYVDVIAETVDRVGTTVYAATVTDTLIDCGAGELGVLSVRTAGSGAGTFDVGPRYSAATATASVPLSELTLDGCTGTATERDLGAATIGLDLVATGPVLTATDFRVFTTASAHGHQRVSITGREGVTGALRIADLTAQPTGGGIGARSAVTHQP